MRFFCSHLRPRYQGIADTFVQLSPSRSAGLIVRVQGEVKESDMARNKTAIVTGAQQGIGTGIVDGFGY
jgi:hypothetical protein